MSLLLVVECSLEVCGQKVHLPQPPFLPSSLCSLERWLQHLLRLPLFAAALVSSPAQKGAQASLANLIGLLDACSTAPAVPQTQVISQVSILPCTCSDQQTEDSMNLCGWDKTTGLA